MYIQDVRSEDPYYIKAWIEHLDKYETENYSHMRNPNRSINWLIIADGLGKTKAFVMILEDLGIPTNLSLKEAIAYYQLIGGKKEDD